MLPAYGHLVIILILKICCFLIGVAVVVSTMASAIKTFVLPRSASERITSIVFLVVRLLFNARASKAATYGERDRIMALYAPLGLIVLLATWLTLVLFSYTAMFWALDGDLWASQNLPPLQTALEMSGSSLFTLGWLPADRLATMLLAFSEAGIGLTLLAILIGYLPTMYAAFSRRESVVTLLEVRAGSPPSAINMLTRFYRIQAVDKLSAQWAAWEVWFAEIEESHTSLAALAFFRSPQPEMSWVTAAGAILDGAALRLALLDLPNDYQAALCIRGGYLALRRVAGFFGIPFNPDPAPDAPISISRAEFDEACVRLADAGLALKDDRDQAWRDYAGWRVNYDDALLGLATLTMAPYAPWSSDRSLPTRRPPALFARAFGRKRAAGEADVQL